MDASSSELDRRTRQQEAVAELGQRALAADDVGQLLHDAAAAVTDTLDTDYCSVLELLPDGEAALLRAGVGWRGDRTGSATVSTGMDSEAGYALVSEEPVVVEDFAFEQRFSASTLLADHDVTSSIDVVVGPNDAPWGVLGAHATDQRAFTEHDANFLRSVANVLASAIENERAESELEEIHGRISEAFFALDEEFRFTHVNDRAHELINPEDRELAGKRVWDAFPEAVGRQFEAEYRHAMREQEAVSFEEYYPEPLDAWFDVRAYPSESGLSVYFRDVTERKRAQQELADERDMFAEGPTTVFRWKNEEGWPVEYVSRNVADLLGYAPEELESGSVAYTELLHDEDVDRIAREVEEHGDGTTERFSHDPYRVETKDGDVKWVQDTTKVLRDENGDVTHYLGYLVDITDREERERELQRAERRFEAIFEDPNILVGMLEPDGTVRDINQTAMEYIDADLEAVVGEPFWETPWWGEGDGVQSDVREWTERAADGEYVEFEADLSLPSGQRYVINGVFRPVTNDDGDVVSVIVSDRDVTERREYERKLAESEQRYRALAENFPNGVVTLYDHDLEYTLAAGQEFAGFPVSPDEVEGRTPPEVWGEDIAADLEPALRSALDGDAGAVEVSYLDREWVVHAVPITDDDGEVFAGMTMAQDVTEQKERERQLAESEQRYRTLAENFPNGAVGVFDEDLRYTLAEGTAIGETLPSAEEAEGSRMPDVFPEDTVENLVPLFRAAVEEGRVGGTTTEFGGRFWRVWAAPLRDADGDIIAGLSLTQDVTEQVEREQQLERYETIVETVNDGVYVVDDDGDFAMVNDAYAEMLGYSREELVGTDASRVVVGGEKVVEVVEELQAETADGRVENASMEAELWTADGERLPAEATFTRLTGDDSEWHRVGVVRDISDRKERERRLTESERRYRALVENFPGGSVGLFDENLEYVAVGGELLDRLDLEPEDRIGQSIREIHPDELVDQLEPHFEAAVNGEPSTFELEFRGRYLRVNVLPIESGDSFTGMVVVQDITERREAQRELRESEARFRMLAENLEEIVWMASADAEEFVYVNPSFEDLFGLDRETLYEEPQSFLDAIHPEDREHVRGLFEALPEQSFDEEYRIVQPDGEVRWIHVKGAQVYDEDGEIVRVVGTGEDVTERKERERELEESERRYRTLAENFPNGAVAVYDHDLRFTLAQGAVLGDTLPGQERVQGQTVRNAFPEDTATELEPLLRDAVENGENGRQMFEFADRHWRVWATPLRNADGDVFAGLSFAQDVTEQVEREQELERALDLLDKTERIADVGGWEIDTETMEVFWTEHIFDLLDVDADEEPALDEALDMYHDEDRVVIEDAIERALDSGEPFDEEVRIYTESGEPRWLRLQGVPETVDGDVVTLRGTAQDVTEQVAREQRLEDLVEKLEESNERLEQFAYAASHDLQEPLRMVSSYLQLVESRYADELDEDGREFIEFAVDGADRMREMIEGLLEYSRVDSRGKPLEPVDLDAVLADVLDDLQVRIEETDAKITHESLPTVDGDAGQLRQLFQNLLDNAIEYSGEDPPHVEITADREGSEWVVSVTDEGVGIDPGDADRVFEVFQSLHTQAEHSGTGIGLALCERIVERHGGDIRVESTPGEKTTFTFTLPAKGEYSE